MPMTRRLLSRAVLHAALLIAAPLAAAAGPAAPAAAVEAAPVLDRISATAMRGNLAFLATSGVNLRLTQERWPKLTFHATREHAARLD